MAGLRGLRETARPHGPLILYYLAILVFGVLFLRFQLSPPAGIPPLRDAMFQHLAAIDRPADEAPVHLVLPHNMAVPGAGRFGGGLYRLEFEYPEGEAAPWSVLIPAYSGRIIVRVNDVLLHDSEWVHTGQAATMVWPVIVPIPAPVLRPGVNRIELRTAMVFGTRTYLGRLYAGPDSLLRPDYQWQHSLRITLPQLLFACQIAFGLLLLVVWGARPSERACALFAAILFVNAVGKLIFIVPASLLHPWLIWSANFSFTWMAALMIPFALSFVGRPLTRFSFLPLALPLGTIVTSATLPPDILVRVNIYVLAPIAVAMFFGCAAIFLDAAFRRGNNGAHVIAGGMLLALLIGSHDLPTMYGGDGERLFTNPSTVPVLLLLVVTGIVLMWRFAAALNEVDRFNVKLRQEIAAAEAALRVSLTREQAQERAITLEAERSRLTRDLHDGLAGQLVSMVALSGRPAANPRDLEVAARRALADLRLVIASMAEVGSDPGMMLANFRDHIEPQLRALGVALDWRMHALPEVSGWSSSTALEMFRLLQEATINAARHSGARQVAIEVMAADDGVRVTVTDKGRGGAVDRPGGYGLANMRRRARDIAAKLTITSSADGTCVSLELPRRGSSDAPA